MIARFVFLLGLLAVAAAGLAVGALREGPAPLAAMLAGGRPH